jgi:hypothetical protein
MRTKEVPISSHACLHDEACTSLPLHRIFLRVLSGSSSLIVLWYHRIPTAHHAQAPEFFMVPLAWVAMKYVPPSSRGRPPALSIQSISKASILRTRWQSSSSPKPMATASSAAFRCSFVASFSLLSGFRGGILLKTLISRRCSW